MTDQRSRLVKAFVAKASTGSPDAMDRNEAAKQANRRRKAEQAHRRQGIWSPRSEQRAQRSPEEWLTPNYDRTGGRMRPDRA